jgi:hypothetical protein
MLVKVLRKKVVALNNVQLFELAEGQLYDLPDWQAGRLIAGESARKLTDKELTEAVEEANRLAGKQLDQKGAQTQLPESKFKDPVVPAAKPPAEAPVAKPPAEAPVAKPPAEAPVAKAPATEPVAAVAKTVEPVKVTEAPVEAPKADADADARKSRTFPAA